MLVGPPARPTSPHPRRMRPAQWCSFNPKTLPSGRSFFMPTYSWSQQMRSANETCHYHRNGIRRFVGSQACTGYAVCGRGRVVQAGNRIRHRFEHRGWLHKQGGHHWRTGSRDAGRMGWADHAVQSALSARADSLHRPGRRSDAGIRQANPRRGAQPVRARLHRVRRRGVHDHQRRFQRRRPHGRDTLWPGRRRNPRVGER